MSKPRVFVTQPIPEIGVQMLKEYFDVSQNTTDRVLSRSQLKKAIRGVDAVLSLLTDHIDDEMISAAGSQLKIIANYAVGFENIDVEAAKKRKIIVTNTPGVLTEAVAEHTMALMISVARRIVESDTYMRSGKYTHWQANLLLGVELQGKTLGIIGLGRIGSRVAQIAQKGFGMTVIYTDVKRNSQFEHEFKSKYFRLNKLLATADIVSLHVPLLPTTRHLINAKNIKSMKRTAILINTSRGPVIDEKSLVRALQRQQITGAGLDVFEYEPRPIAGMESLSNLVATPHIASATIEARTAMAKIAAENITDVLSGKKPLNPVY